MATVFKGDVTMERGYYVDETESEM